ncbi:MAG: hypothetical protein ABI054_12285, partial [Planctomycetota bacterium]
GLEELAARAPRVLERLRAAIAAGRLEITGASYAQPCASLHGGESNLRQRVLGARAVQRLLGQRVRAVWEGAANFCPQLPQIQRALGVESLCLLPATEEFIVGVPPEPRTWLAWSGHDGTRLGTLAANSLSVAFANEALEESLVASLAEKSAATLLVWLPLEPERLENSWQRLDALRADPRFDFQPISFSALAAALASSGAGSPVSYSVDDFFHGSAPAKNGDLLVRGVAWCEEQLLAAESLVSLLGRMPGVEGESAAWPAWEFDESWRELCVAQHHAIAAREQRLAAVAECSIERSLALAQEVHERTLFHLGQNVQGLEGGHLVLNPLGWVRDVLHDSGVARSVPAFGYRVVDPYDLDVAPLGRVRVREHEDRIALVRGRMRVEVDRRRGVIEQISTREFPEGVLDPEHPLLDLSLMRGGREERFPDVEVVKTETEDLETDELTIRRTGRGGVNVTIQVAIEPLFDAVWIRVQSDELPRPDPGARAGLGFELRPRLGDAVLLRADHPYGISEVGAPVDRERRCGGSAASSEVVDVLTRPFTALRFVDLSAEDGKRGLLYVHDGSPAFSRIDGGVRHSLATVDPLDEGSFESALMADMWIVPHAGMGDAERMRRAMECTLGNPRFVQSAEIRGGGSLPGSMGALRIEPHNVLVTAFWREPPASREGLENSLGGGDQTVFAVRLVEFDGEDTQARLCVAGRITRAVRTDLLGEVLEELAFHPCHAVFGPESAWSEISIELAANAIATVQFF